MFFIFCIFDSDYIHNKNSPNIPLLVSHFCPNLTFVKIMYDRGNQILSEAIELMTISPASLQWIVYYYDSILF